MDHSFPKTMGPLLGAALGLFACSSSTHPPPANDQPDGEVQCATDSLLNVKLGPYAPASLPLTKPGDGGKLSFVLVNPTPNPPEQQTNSWTIQVLDAMGHPVKDATISFPDPLDGTQNPWMPHMSHGSIALRMSMNNGDGTYTIPNIYFSMGGVWELRIQAQSGSTTDSTTFTFCVP